MMSRQLLLDSWRWAVLAKYAIVSKEFKFVGRNAVLTGRL